MILNSTCRRFVVDPAQSWWPPDDARGSRAILPGSRLPRSAPRFGDGSTPVRLPQRTNHVRPGGIVVSDMGRLPPSASSRPSNTNDLLCSVANFSQKTDQPNSNRQDPDGDAQYGCCRVHTCGNPDNADADDPERNEIRQYGVVHGVTPEALLHFVALGAPRLLISPQATLAMWPSKSRSVIAAGPKLILSPDG